MANQTDHVLTVRGDPVELERFKAAVRGHAVTEGVLDFERHLPTPPDLPNEISPGADVETKSTWRLRHWGTDVNALYPTVRGTLKSGRLVYRFSTRYDPPFAWLQAVASAHPKLNFELSWREEFGYSEGTAQWENGEYVPPVVARIRALIAGEEHVVTLRGRELEVEGPGAAELRCAMQALPAEPLQTGPLRGVIPGTEEPQGLLAAVEHFADTILETEGVEMPYDEVADLDVYRLSDGDLLVPDVVEEDDDPLMDVFAPEQRIVARDSDEYHEWLQRLAAEGRSPSSLGDRQERLARETVAENKRTRPSDA